MDSILWVRCASGNDLWLTFTFPHFLPHLSDSDWMNFGMVAIIFPKFLFGTEIRMSQINHEGWLVGVWEVDSWDQSHQF